MTYVYRPAVKENVQALVGFIGPSWSGKTYSAFRFSTGLAEGGKIAVIDTESGRAKHYADDFEFAHFDLSAPYSPRAYADKIEEVDQLGVFSVIVIDSVSHEHNGEGGMLEMHEAELNRMAGDNWKKRDKMTQLAWAKPKMEHRRFVNRFLRAKAHLIFCFRAEEKSAHSKAPDGSLIVTPAMDRPLAERWEPIEHKGLKYEMTATVLLPPTTSLDEVGKPVHVKVNAKHRHIFPVDRQIDEEAGRLMAEWARGAPPVDPATLLSDARLAAAFGRDRFKAWFLERSVSERRALEPHLADLKATASKATTTTTEEQP